jgi:hypothetical protein
VIPTRKNARSWKRRTAGAQARNDILRATQRLGRRIWKTWSGYHRRSLVETKMRCFKLLGEPVMARTFERQVAELQIRAAGGLGRASRHRIATAEVEQRFGTQLNGIIQGLEPLRAQTFSGPPTQYLSGKYYEAGILIQYPNSTRFSLQRKCRPGKETIA